MKHFFRLTNFMVLEKILIIERFRLNELFLMNMFISLVGKKIKLKIGKYA